jgi:hypothetical protein
MVYMGFGPLVLKKKKMKDIMWKGFGLSNVVTRIPVVRSRLDGLDFKLFFRV